MSYTWLHTSGQQSGRRNQEKRASISSRILSLGSQVTHQSHPVLFPRGTGSFGNAWNLTAFWDEALVSIDRFVCPSCLTCKIYDTASILSIQPNSEQHMLNPHRIMGAFNPHTHHYPTGCIHWAPTEFSAYKSDKSEMHAELFPDSNHLELFIEPVPFSEKGAV